MAANSAPWVAILVVVLHCVGFGLGFGHGCKLLSFWNFVVHDVGHSPCIMVSAILPNNSYLQGLGFGRGWYQRPLNV